VTEAEYLASLKALGLMRFKPSYEGAAIYQDRDGEFRNVPDADQLLPSERSDFIELLMGVHGYTRAH
jgi:hypothetical protein